MNIAQLIATRSASEIYQCKPGDLVRDVVGKLAEHRIGALPVVENGTVTGIFSERDFIYRTAETGTACLDMQVSEVMTAPPITVSPETKILQALGLMTKRRIRHLPVVENGQMAGFISIGDLVKFRIDQIESEAEAMRDYIQMA